MSTKCSVAEHNQPGEAAVPNKITQLAHRLRTEGDSPARQAAAVGLGLFIGCSPFFGMHLPICLFAGWLFGLNRLKIYIAANISNPFISPLIVFAEIQIGGWIRRGRFYPVSLETLVEGNLWNVALDLLLGAVVLGAVLGVAGATVTHALVGRFGLDRTEGLLIEKTAHRYLTSGFFTWEFANGKLRFDPVYRGILKKGSLPETGTFLDLGCGRGLLLTFLLEARKQYRNQVWPAGWPPPPQLSLIGLECRSKYVKKARSALDGGASIELADIGIAPLPSCHSAALLDVLHYLERDEQDDLLQRLQKTLEPGGLLLIREADADAGWGFVAVRVTERFRSLARGDWRRRVYYRSAQEWISRLEALGFSIETEDMGRGTPFANILIHAKKEAA